MITRTAEDLHNLVTAVLLAAGADERNAAIVADHLVLSNLSGVDTHGVLQLPKYVGAIRAGYLAPIARPAVLRETSTSALVTGNWTFGQVAARFGMEVAVAKAAEQNVAVVGIVQSHHIGRVGTYAEMAAAAGMVSIITAGGFGPGTRASVPYGGRQRLLHTNPIAIGFPAGEEPPLVLDYATTALSAVKVENAHRRKELLPPGRLVDKDGLPTTDPAAFFSGGGILPFGEHKGWALMMAMEFLGGILTGSEGHAAPEHGGPIFGLQGVTMVVLRADLFQPLAEYAARADAMERKARAVPPAPGFQEVLVPGDPEARCRVQREREGIPIADDIWQTVVEAATSLGLKV
jgi:LDH2 family malate/lactate/ureidoglycolate dehydrogenase